MVTIRTKVTLRRRGNLANHLAKIEKSVKGPKAVKVGFPSGRTDGDVVQIAIWNHFGTAGSGKGFVSNGVGGFGGPIPPRPFITVAMFKNRRETRARLRAAAKKIIMNGKPMNGELTDLGRYGRRIIQNQISSNMGPPNSPLTIKIKGSAHTLIHNGTMFGAVTWELDK